MKSSNVLGCIALLLFITQIAWSPRVAAEVLPIVDSIANGFRIPPRKLMRIRTTPMSVDTPSPDTKTHPCNGSFALCGRRYNEATYLMTHNGASNSRNGTLDIYNRFARKRGNINNQDLSLQEQFRLGVRATKTPVHYSQGPFPIRSCHGLSPGDRAKYSRIVCNTWVTAITGKTCHSLFESLNPCYLDPSDKPLMHLLLQVVTLMIANPNEVFTVFLSDQTGGGQLGRVLSEISSTPGLVPMLYVQNPNQPWPTLREMIDSRKRIVLFMDVPASDWSANPNAATFLNRTQESILDIPYSFPSVEALQNDQGHQRVNSYLFPNRSNPMWQFSHYVTPFLAGEDNAASDANWVQGPLSSRLERYTRSLERNPTFISVDFVESSPLFSTSDVFDLVWNMNRK